jgi:hypothetical protein
MDKQITNSKIKYKVINISKMIIKNFPDINKGMKAQFLGKK